MTTNPVTLINVDDSDSGAWQEACQRAYMLLTHYARDADERHAVTPVEHLGEGIYRTYLHRADRSLYVEIRTHRTCA